MSDHSFHQVIAWVTVTPPINDMTEKLEYLWLTVILLRVQESFGCYVSLCSVRSARGLTALTVPIAGARGRVWVGSEIEACVDLNWGPREAPWHSTGGGF